jgi:hypothetical protein
MQASRVLNCLIAVAAMLAATNSVGQPDVPTFLTLFSPGRIGSCMAKNTGPARF